MEPSQENTPQPRFRSHHDRIIPGLRPLVPVQQPAAGADWTATVPEGRAWRILGGSATFTASAAVGNRILGIQVVYSGVQLWASANSNVVAASGSGVLLIQPVATPVSTNTSATRRWVDRPDFWIPGQSIISPFNSSILAGDQWSAITLLVEERWEDDENLTLHHQAVEDALEALVAGTPSQQTPGG